MGFTSGIGTMVRESVLNLFRFLHAAQQHRVLPRLHCFMCDSIQVSQN